MRVDGSKAPATEWKRYQSEQPSETQIGEWFGPSRGVGIVTGVGGVGLLEFETDPVFVRWVRDMVAAGHAEDLRKICDGYLARSGGAGWHLIYRTPEPGKNTRLACVDSADKGGAVFKGYERGEAKTSMVLIETRGVGGFVVVAGGDPAVHSTGRAYERVILPDYLVAEPMRNWRLDPDRGVVVLDRARVEKSRQRPAGLSPAPDRLHEVSAELRDTMFSLARRQDQRTPKAAKSERRSELSSRIGQGSPGARPGDAWAAVTTWDEILEPHGWRRDHSTDESDRWTRPGKASGTSATTNYAGSGLLYVFTSSTEFEPETTYSKFGAYAVLNHDGDHEAAARGLVEKGFADPLRAEADTREQRVMQMAVHREMQLEADEVARRSRAARDWRPPLVVTGRDEIDNPSEVPTELVSGLILDRGITLMSAQNKTGKSTVGVNVVFSLLYGEPLFGTQRVSFPETSRVAVLNAEVDQGIYAKWCRARGVFDDPDVASRVTFIPCASGAPDIQDPMQRGWLLHAIADCDFLLIDPASKVFRGEENSNTEVNAWWRSLRGLMSEAGIPSALVIHHAGHEGRAARGASAWEGDAEVVLRYAHDGGPGEVPTTTRRYLTGMGRIDNIPQLALDFDAENHRLFIDRKSVGREGDRQAREDKQLAQIVWKLLDKAHEKEGADWISKVAIKNALAADKAVKIGQEKAIREHLPRCETRGYIVVDAAERNGVAAKVRRGKVDPNASRDNG